MTDIFSIIDCLSFFLPVSNSSLYILTYNSIWNQFFMFGSVDFLRNSVLHVDFHPIEIQPWRVWFHVDYCWMVTPCSRNIFIKKGSVLQVFLIPFVVNSKGEKRNLNTKLLDNYLLLSASALLTHFYRRFEFNSSLEFFKTDN